MGGTGRYNVSNGFDTFAFPQNLNSVRDQQLEAIGKVYYDHLRQLILLMHLGLTKTYNLFHSQSLATLSLADETLEDKIFAKQFGKDALYLLKHLAKTPSNTNFNEAVKGIIKLRELHVEMHATLLDAYGWQGIQLQHNFYEVDYLPENDRVRYTIHPEADLSINVSAHK